MPEHVSDNFLLGSSMTDSFNIFNSAAFFGLPYASFC